MSKVRHKAVHRLGWVPHLSLSQAGLQGCPGALSVVVGAEPLLDGLHPAQGCFQALTKLLLLLLSHEGIHVLGG